MRLLVVLLALCVAGPAVSAQRAVPSHAPTPVPVHEVVRVNGVAIMSDRLDQAVNRLIPLESFHRTVSADKIAELRQKALDGLIDDELEHQDGLRLGVAVADADVKAELTRRRIAAPTADVRAEMRRALIIQKTRDRVVTATCQVSRAEAERFFTANPERFVVPEQLRIYAITIGVAPSAPAKQWSDASALAADVHRQLLAGASFADMARKYSTDPSRDTGGDMGFIHRGSLSEEFEQAAASLHPGQASGVIQSLYGYHLIQIGEIRPPQPRTFAQVGADLARDLTAQRCEQARDAWVARLRAAATIVPAPSTPRGPTHGPPGRMP